MLIPVAAMAADKPPSQPRDPPGIVRMTAEQQKTIGLKTARVEPRAITEPVQVPGTIMFDQGHVAILHTLAQARVLRLLVQPGDPVQVGQPLAELDGFVRSRANARSGNGRTADIASSTSNEGTELSG